MDKTEFSVYFFDLNFTLIKSTKRHWKQAIMIENNCNKFNFMNFDKGKSAITNLKFELILEIESKTRVLRTKIGKFWYIDLFLRRYLTNSYANFSHFSFILNKTIYYSSKSLSQNREIANHYTFNLKHILKEINFITQSHCIE